MDSKLENNAVNRPPTAKQATKKSLNRHLRCESQDFHNDHDINLWLKNLKKAEKEKFAIIK